MFPGKNTIAGFCAVALLSGALSALPPTFAGRNRDPEFFAGHRVLKFHRSKRGLLIDPTMVILQDREGVTWVGSYDGLYAYDERKNQWLGFREQTKDPSFRLVKNLCQDNAGRIWLLATRSKIRVFEGLTWFASDQYAPPVSLDRVAIM